MRVAAVVLFLLAGFPASMGRAQEEEPKEPPARKGWLERHQAPDGSWDPARFDDQCEKPHACTGAGLSEDRAGATALALLCYLGFGETTETPRYGHVVKKGFRWFLETQEETGGFPPLDGGSALLGQARATLALVKLKGVTKDPAVGVAAQRAVAHLLSLRLEKGGWPSSPKGKETDLETSAWAVMAIAAAAKEGLEVGKEPYGSFRAWLDEGTDGETGRFGPKPKASGLAERNPFAPEPEPPPPPETPTAMAIHCRLVMGASPRETPVARGFAILIACLPKLVENIREPDLTFAFFGSLACGRADKETLKRWNESMKRMVIDSQCMEREACRWGSWETSSSTTPGGRVAATALGTLTLMEYYRAAR